MPTKALTLNFDECSNKGNEFVDLVACDLQITKERSVRFIRAVFHALRKNFSHEESFQLLEHLPIVLKGVYVDGWHFDKDIKLNNNKTEFLEDVRHEYVLLTGHYLGSDTQVKAIVKTVFKAMNYVITKEDMMEIDQLIPVDAAKMDLQS